MGHFTSRKTVDDGCIWKDAAMLLYRARTIASRPSRQAPFTGNDAAHRIAGRWFTSSIAAAVRHRATLAGDTEIVEVSVPDAITESFRVATTPITSCGIDAAAYSAEPDTDYILPMFRVMDAETIVVVGFDRVRDVIDVNAPASRRRPTVIEMPATGRTELPLAA